MLKLWPENYEGQPLLEKLAAELEFVGDEEKLTLRKKLPRKVLDREVKHLVPEVGMKVRAVDGGELKPTATPMHRSQQADPQDKDPEWTLPANEEA